MRIKNIKSITKCVRFKVFFSLLTVSVILSLFYFVMSKIEIKCTMEHICDCHSISGIGELADNIKYTAYECRSIKIVVSLLIVVLLCVYFERKIVHPIKNLEKQIAKQLSLLEENKILGKVYIDEPFEIVNLANAFNEMLSNIEKSSNEIADLKDRIEHGRIRTEFFTNLSHEMRTPLNVIFSTIQLFELYLKKGTVEDKDGKISGNLNAVKQNCFRLIKLTNNMIDMAKLDTNYYDIHLKNVNIINIVRNITKSAAEYIANKGKVIIFKTNMDKKIVACDSESIERIMLNLLSNAAKFSKPGGKIYVNVIDKGEFIKISVKDNGVGIPESKLNNIFDRFIQVDRSLTRQHEGIGIGLFIVNSLVKMHGGKIYVKSKPGEGSEFSVKLPAKTVQDEDGENEVINYKICKEHMDKVAIEFSDIY